MYLDNKYLLNKSIFLDIISGFFSTNNVFLSVENHKKFPRTFILHQLTMENAYISCLALVTSDKLAWLLDSLHRFVIKSQYHEKCYTFPKLLCWQYKLCDLAKQLKNSVKYVKYSLSVQIFNLQVRWLLKRSKILASRSEAKRSQLKQI